MRVLPIDCTERISLSVELNSCKFFFFIFPLSFYQGFVVKRMFRGGDVVFPVVTVVDIHERALVPGRVV